MTIAFNPPVVCPIVIGRTSDLTTLRLLVDRAKSGEGQVVLLSGEAGIGKSRLVAEVKTEAFSHDFWLLQGSCFPTDHAIPYAPLLDLLRSHFSSHTWALPVTEAEALAQAFLPLLPELGRLLPGRRGPQITDCDRGPLLRQRRVLHRTIGEAMEQLYSTTLDTHLADLAYHFYESGAWEKALEYAQHAGENAQRLYAPRTAVEQFTRALEAAHHWDVTMNERASFFAVRLSWRRGLLIPNCMPKA